MTSRPLLSIPARSERLAARATRHASINRSRNLTPATPIRHWKDQAK